MRSPASRTNESGPQNGAAFLVISWLSYVAFYLCRQNLSVVLAVFSRDQLYTTAQCSELVLFFSAAYCLGQFLIGGIVDRFGARRVLVAGMIVSGCSTAMMGIRNDYAWLLFLQTINGVAQAAGWVGLVKMIKVYPIRRRAVGMGWWSTNYVVGGMVATSLATWALNAPGLARGDWRNAVWIPGAILFVFALLFQFLTRHMEAIVTEETLPKEKKWFGVFQEALSTSRIRVLVSAYFLIKLIRYSLLFWLPVLLAGQLHILPVRAGYLSSWLSAVGILGVLSAAYLSDYLFRAKRFPVAMLMMVLLTVTCLWASKLNVNSEYWFVILVMALLGYATYGADTLLVGAAAQDAARSSHMGTIAGIVDGTGSIGAVLSPLLVSLIMKLWGWPAVFEFLAVIAGLCAALLLWGRATEDAAVEV
jgi:sugar phosphate permease